VRKHRGDDSRGLWITMGGANIENSRICGWHTLQVYASFLLCN
jgi:hypothetical protein